MAELTGRWQIDPVLLAAVGHNWGQAEILAQSVEFAVGGKLASFPGRPHQGGELVKIRRQFIRGSWTNASSMAITLSRLLRSTRMTFSHV